MAHGRNVCYWCDCPYKFASYEYEGNDFCSATCVKKFQEWSQKEQLAFQLQPEVSATEDDACQCHRCRDP